jgi:tetratricopeptide (TPR) repeat protein
MARRRDPFSRGGRGGSDPRDPMDMAIAAHREGRLKQAERLYRAVLKADKNSTDGHRNLATLFHQQGRLAEATQSIQKALAIEPDRPEIQAVAGMIHVAAGRFRQGIEAYRRAVEIEPRDPELRCHLAHALRRSGDFREAAKTYREVLEVDRRNVEALCGLAVALREMGEFDEGCSHVEQALTTDPGSFPAWLTLGTLHRARGSYPEAIDCFRKAVAIQPQAVGANSNLGLTLQEAGRTDEAIAAFRRAVETAPDSAEIRFMLASARRHTERDEEVAWLEQCAKTPQRFGATKHDAWFTLSRVRAELGDEESAFEWVARANAAKRKTFEYDVEDDRARFGKIRETFGRERLAAAAGSGSPDRTPVFVVGMPRSGTSLVEQILASHAEVFGADELDDVRYLAEDDERFSGGYPDGFRSPEDAAMREAADAYLRRVRSLAPEATRVVDKMPINFVYLGAIRLWFPNAKVLHCIRDARDTCTSVYRQNFHGHLPFAYDLTELGRYYRLYEELMDHWRSVLGDEFLLDVRYEDVVDDLEGQARRMCGFLDLPWDEACVRYHETDRAVRTMSGPQVRRPIYRSSIGAWRRQEARLAPLLAELGPRGEQGA